MPPRRTTIPSPTKPGATSPIKKTGSIKQTSSTSTSKTVTRSSTIPAPSSAF